MRHHSDTDAGTPSLKEPHSPAPTYDLDVEVGAGEASGGSGGNTSNGSSPRELLLSKTGRAEDRFEDDEHYALQKRPGSPRNKGKRAYERES